MNLDYYTECAECGRPTTGRLGPGFSVICASCKNKQLASEQYDRWEERIGGIPEPDTPTVEALLAEVERLTAERDFHVAQTDAIADEWQRENEKLNACRAERDALAGQLAKVRNGGGY
jgi:hypothetical protein